MADQHAESYTVQVAAYKSLPDNFIESAERFGAVHTSLSGELTLISTGKFSNRSAAQKLLSRLKRAGYEDAFVQNIVSGMAGNQHPEYPSSEMAKL